MTLLSLNGTVPAEWTILGEDDTPEEGASVAVSLVRLERDSDETLLSAGKIGLFLETETDYTALAPHIRKLDFVDIHFPAFTDGRGFSLAVRLRKDLGFKGEIRASGHVIPDQALFLLRAGFDTADVTQERKAAFEKALERFNSFYQTDYLGTRSIAHQRHAKPEQRKAS